jgi:hypothetical protein
MIIDGENINIDIKISKKEEFNDFLVFYNSKEGKFDFLVYENSTIYRDGLNEDTEYYLFGHAICNGLVRISFNNYVHFYSKNDLKYFNELLEYITKKAMNNLDFNTGKNVYDEGEWSDKA